MSEQYFLNNFLRHAKHNILYFSKESDESKIKLISLYKKLYVLKKGMPTNNDDAIYSFKDKDNNHFYFTKEELKPNTKDRKSIERKINHLNSNLSYFESRVISNEKLLEITQRMIEGESLSTNFELKKMFADSLKDSIKERREELERAMKEQSEFYEIFYKPYREEEISNDKEIIYKLERDKIWTYFIKDSFKSRFSEDEKIRRIKLSGLRLEKRVKRIKSFIKETEQFIGRVS